MIWSCAALIAAQLFLNEKTFIQADIKIKEQGGAYK